MTFFRFVPNPIAAALKKRSVTLTGLTRDEAIQAAAENVDRIADDYRIWLEEELGVVRGVFSRYRADMAGSPEAYDALRQKVEDVRDTAGSFGFDLVTEVADSFSRVLHVNRPDSRVYAEAVDLHMDTLQLLSLSRLGKQVEAQRDGLLHGLHLVVAKLSRI